MNMPDIIMKKKRGGALSDEEIQFFVQGAASGRIRDEQLAALLMAICLRGMDARETASLTLCMAASGRTLSLNDIGGVPVDKHSTGGVGDTTTLVLVPLVAACGAKVAKMSGRGLGHTGGTIDKMESIPGMRVMLTPTAFKRQLRSVGCVVVGQSKALAPADKKLYALRDVTATVDSVPLIASSIMSKKLASGAQGIVLDVKTGSGALMNTVEESVTLARAMVDIGTRAGRHMTALVTGMHEPLGTHVGNALEVREAIDILAGRAQGRLLTLSLTLGAYMLISAGITRTVEEGRALLARQLGSGAGLERLAMMIAAQGGDARVCEDLSLLPQAPVICDVPARRAGYVTRMRTTDLGSAAQRMGAGRAQKTDIIDPAVGFVMRVQLGDRVEAGQPLATLHARREEDAQRAAADVEAAIDITDEAAPLPRLVDAVVTADGVTYCE